MMSSLALRCDRMLYEFGLMDPHERAEFAWTWTPDELEALLCAGVGGAVNLYGHVSRYRDRELTPGYELRAALEQAASVTPRPPEVIEDVEANRPQPPRYPTPILPLQAITNGHYGLTVVGGDEGVGKSSVCAGVAVLAALDGWRVVYINAELTAERLGFYTKRLRTARHIPRDVLERITFVHFLVGTRFDDVVDVTCHSIRPDDGRVLVVLDSVNTILDKEASRDGYFDRMKRWALWAMEARRITDGRVSFLMTSELNQRKEATGIKLKYLADMVLIIQKTASKNYCDVNVSKGRYSGSEKLGALYLDYHTGQFEGEAT